MNCHRSTTSLALALVAIASTAAADTAPPTKRVQRGLTLELGGGSVHGIATNADFDRTNPGLFGVVLMEQRRSWSPWAYGVELAVGIELSSEDEDEPGGFGYMLAGGRLGYRPTGDRGLGLWGSLRLGMAGHTASQFTMALAAGAEVMITRRLGVGATASVHALSPGRDHQFDRDVDAAIVGTAGVHLVGHFAL